MVVYLSINDYILITHFCFIFLCYSIVGDDDGGKLFTPEEYEEYKRRVLPQVSLISSECNDVTSGKWFFQQWNVKADGGFI